MAGTIVRCPECGAKNRVDREKAHTARPRCARCHAALGLPGPQTTPLDVTDGTFAELVERSPVLVLLAFWSPYCMHCQTFDPVLRALTPEASQQVRVARLNLDENRVTGTRYGVNATPTVLMLDRGREIDRMQGALTADQLRYRLHRHLHP